MNKENLYKAIDENGLTATETIKACEELEKEVCEITVKEIVGENRKLKDDLEVAKAELERFKEGHRELSKKLRRLKDLVELIVMLNEAGMYSVGRPKTFKSSAKDKKN